MSSRPVPCVGSSLGTIDVRTVAGILRAQFEAHELNLKEKINMNIVTTENEDRKETIDSIYINTKKEENEMKTFELCTRHEHIICI